MNPDGPERPGSGGIPAGGGGAVGGGASGGARGGLLLVGAVACLANFGALAPGFIHDDHRIIEQNELIRGLAHLPEIFAKGYWSVSSASVPILYRPVTILSFALNHAAGGLHPFGYRLANLLLHALVAMLVAGLGRRLFAPGTALRDPALLAGLLFAVHPIHTEVLGEVVGRSELLAAAGTLGAVLLFLRSRGRRAEGRSGPAAGLAVLAVACFLAAFLSKENAVAAPFLIVLADLLLVRRRPAWGVHAAFAAALAAGLVGRAAALGSLNPPGAIHFADNPIIAAPWLPGRFTALAVAARYARLLVLPAGMSIDYSFNAVPLSTGPLEPAVLAGAALVALWAFTVLAARGRAPGIAFAAAWIGVAFAPVSNFVLPIGTLMAERLLYLPSVGFCLLAGAALARLGGRAAGGPGRGSVAAAAAIPAVLLLALAARGVVRLRDWRDDYTIFRRALEVAPGSVRSLYNFGAACEERGEDGAARDAYLQAVAIWPGFADAHYNLAGVYGRLKRWDDAVSHYRDASRLQPGNVRFLVNLGQALNTQGNPAEARRVLEEAIGLDRSSAEAFTDLGAADLALGDAPAAERAYREALRLVPASPAYLRNLAVAQQEAGDLDGAEETLGRALGLRAGDADLLLALGAVRLKRGDAAGAAGILRDAVRARPGQPIPLYQLGRALEASGRPTEAADAYRESIRLAPDSPVPLRSLGLLLARGGDRASALQALERAAALDPGGRVMDEEARRVLRGLRAARPPAGQRGRGA
jgi:tetratricopeptide (TPR) repeat protein